MVTFPIKLKNPNFEPIQVGFLPPKTRALVKLCFTQLSAFVTVRYYHITCEFQSESTLYSLPECQKTPCSKQAPYLKLK